MRRQIRLRCPWCHARSAFFDVKTDTRDGWNVAVCGACHTPVVVYLRTEVLSTHHEDVIATAYYPRPFDEPTYEGVPEDVALSALEAHRCVSIDAWNAVGTMARRAMQAAALERGAPAGNAAQQIKWLGENGHVSGTLVTLA